MLLPREHLPLSALDLCQPHGDFPPIRLFESHIKILDLEGRLGSNVLLARSETSRLVYAIEREGNGLYVLCKLGTWADIENLSRAATVVCSPRMRGSNPPPVNASAVAPLITPHMHTEGKRKKLAIEEIESMVRRRSIAEKDSQGRLAAPLGNPTPSDDTAHQPAGSASDPPKPAADWASDQTKLETPTPALVPENESPMLPSADDIFQNIRTQYFEALYHSMVGATETRAHSTFVLTGIGIAGIFCKGPAISGSSILPP